MQFFTSNCEVINTPKNMLVNVSSEIFTLLEQAIKKPTLIR